MLFGAFVFSLFLSIVITNYYNYYVYNDLIFVQNTVQAFIFKTVLKIREFRLNEARRAQVINLVSKDVWSIEEGSWCFPYLVIVPFNTIFMGIILFQMVRLQSPTNLAVRLRNLHVLFGRDPHRRCAVLRKQGVGIDSVRNKRADRQANLVHHLSHRWDQDNKILLVGAILSQQGRTRAQDRAQRLLSLRVARHLFQLALRKRRVPSLVSHTT